MSFEELYAVSQQLKMDDIFVWPKHAHSMALSLDRYVENKLPTEYLNKVIRTLKRVKVLGIYPAHFDTSTVRHNFEPTKRIPFAPKPHAKRFNYIRPNFYISLDGQTIYVCVPPGLAYLKQYASLLRYFCLALRDDIDFEVRFYPMAAERIAEWTSLSQEIFSDNCTCIIGHVDEFERHTPEIKDRIKTITDNQYFARSSFQLSNNKTVELIGFKFSFWGDISGRLVAQLYKNGCREVIYFGKVGALERDIELYQTIMVPRTFMLAEHDRVDQKPFEVSNKLADFVRSKTHHVSTPTVMEQSYVQRRVLEDFKPYSIDNEIAYMALAAKQFNDTRSGQAPVDFSSISFATDYVRRAHEHQAPYIFDLSNNRTRKALEFREKAVAMIAKRLYQYLLQ